MALVAYAISTKIAGHLPNHAGQLDRQVMLDINLNIYSTLLYLKEMIRYINEIKMNKEILYNQKNK